MAPVDRPHTTYYSSATLTIALSCIIFEIKRNIGWKSQFVYTPVAFDVLARGSPLEYCHCVWYGESRMVWLLEGEKSL